MCLALCRLALCENMCVCNVLKIACAVSAKFQGMLRGNRYSFSVKALSKVLRAKYVQHLRANGMDDKTLIKGLFQAL